MVEDLSERISYYLPVTHGIGMRYYRPVAVGFLAVRNQQVRALGAGWIRGKLRVIMQRMFLPEISYEERNVVVTSCVQKASRR
jgi:hypothetical protein